MIHKHYPKPDEMNSWCRKMLSRADRTKFRARLLNEQDRTYSRPGIWHVPNHRFVAFSGKGFDRFCCYWQPVISPGPAPILIHLPGYGAEISAHPELVAAGYNVLHVNPLGYATPEGGDEGKRGWVLPDTITSFGKK